MSRAMLRRVKRRVHLRIRLHEIDVRLVGSCLRRVANALLDHRDDHREIRPSIRENMSVQVVVGDRVELVKPQRLP
jgi:hypothetical protein